MHKKNQEIVAAFIDQVWNERKFDKLKDLIHRDFTDHSLLPTLTPDINGLTTWIRATGKSFEHKTVIEEQLTDGDKTFLKIKMELKHIGKWREIEATGIELSTTGYRLFRIKDGKIIEHWALIDGQIIENTLNATHQGCQLKATNDLPGLI